MGRILFFSNKNEKCSTISMYNHNLEMVQTFGQENSILPFFFSSGINRFLVSNQYFIFYEPIIDEGDEYHTSVTIINRSNGFVEASFKIYEHFGQTQLYLDKFLVTFNNETCIVKCYNFQGDLLEKITLDKKFEGSVFISVINKELCFVLKSKNLCIF
jgi:hypothetical protein